MPGKANIRCFINVLFCRGCNFYIQLSEATSIYQGVAMQSIKILRLKDVIAKTGLSRSTIYVLLSAGKFPKKIQLSPRCIGFLEADVDTWLYEKTFCNG